MPIQNAEEFDKVINVSWYTPEKPREEQTYVSRLHLFKPLLTRLRFPCVLPFSQMYPLCCIDVRNFMNQIYFFSNDDFPHLEVVDETLKTVGIVNSFAVFASTDSGRLWMTFYPTRFARPLCSAWGHSISDRLSKFLLTWSTLRLRARSWNSCSWRHVRNHQLRALFL